MAPSEASGGVSTPCVRCSGAARWFGVWPNTGAWVGHIADIEHIHAGQRSPFVALGLVLCVMCLPHAC